MNDKTIAFLGITLITISLLIINILSNQELNNYKKDHKECIHWVRSANNTPNNPKIKLILKHALLECSDRSYQETIYNINH